MIELVIFDMDGVLADTEQSYRQMNMQFLAARGFAMTDREYDAFIGIHAPRMWREWKERFGLPESVESLVAGERESKFRMLRDGPLKAVEGAPELLAELRKSGLKLAVASSSLRQNVDLVLERLNIAHLFTASVAGDEVQLGKPDPEIFLRAAGQLGIQPKNCAVVEDARLGIQAAKAAGMFAIGLQGAASGGQDLGQADLLVRHLSELTAATFRS